MGEIHRLRVESPYELMKILDIKIENKPNEHGYLFLKCLIDEKINFDYAIKASANDKICVYEAPEDENISYNENSVNINIVDERVCKVLFKGIVENINTRNVDGVYYVEIQALTISSQLDIEEKSRSFQNVNMTYDDLINEILSEYLGYGFKQFVGNGQPIGKPLFQYRETDWSFFKRVASELKSDIYCDIMEIKNIFSFGRPQEHAYILKDSISYKAWKNLKRFYQASGSGKYNDTDYFYYEVKIRDKLEICSQIYFKQKELYIRDYEAYVDRGELIYNYKICRKDGVWQERIYNKYLKGAAIEGKVLAVQGEMVKLHLDIDKNQSEDEATWFYYAPITGNILYSMPLVGESAMLYFTNETTENPMVTSCVRKNRATCDRLYDTANRYFETEYGKVIEMLPDALNIKSGSEENLSIKFEDETGVTIKSPSGLSLNAGGEVVISTPNNVNINATSQILMKKGKTSNVSLESEINISGGATISNGSDRTAFPKFTDDEPIQVQIVVEPKPLEGHLITKDSAKLLKDVNGNDISFADACSAINALQGSKPSCGSVIANGDGNSGADNSNSGNSSWNQADWSAYLSLGNDAGIGTSSVQVGLEAGKVYIPRVISNAIKPTYSFEFKNIMAAKAVQNAERLDTAAKMGSKGGWIAAGLDVYLSYKADAADKNISPERRNSNAYVNGAFDAGGVVLSNAAGVGTEALIASWIGEGAVTGSAVPGYGTAIGALAGLVVGLVYIGATQVWKPGGESIQDRVKDAIANPDDNVKQAANKTRAGQDIYYANKIANKN